MAELKAKKFGYVVHPPHCHPFSSPYPAPPPPPPGISMTDWVAYINSYIDVRARQLYDKLKGMYSQIDESTIVRDYILLKDQATGQTKKLYVYNDNLFTEDL